MQKANKFKTLCIFFPPFTKLLYQPGTPHSPLSLYLIHSLSQSVRTSQEHTICMLYSGALKFIRDLPPNAPPSTLWGVPFHPRVSMCLPRDGEGSTLLHPSPPGRPYAKVVSIYLIKFYYFILSGSFRWS